MQNEEYKTKRNDQRGELPKSHYVSVFGVHRMLRRAGNSKDPPGGFLKPTEYIDRSSQKTMQNEEYKTKRNDQRGELGRF
jgi:hypothetical protein